VVPPFLSPCLFPVIPVNPVKKDVTTKPPRHKERQKAFNHRGHRGHGKKQDWDVVTQGVTKKHKEKRKAVLTGRTGKRRIEVGGALLHKPLN